VIYDHHQVCAPPARGEASSLPSVSGERWGSCVLKIAASESNGRTLLLRLPSERRNCLALFEGRSGSASMMVIVDHHSRGYPSCCVFLSLRPPKDVRLSEGRWGYGVRIRVMAIYDLVYYAVLLMLLMIGRRSVTKERDAATAYTLRVTESSRVLPYAR